MRKIVVVKSFTREIDVTLIDQVKVRFSLEPATEPALWTAWNTIVDKIHAHVLSKRPLPKVQEVHHLNQTARANLLREFADGKTIEVATDTALRSIGL